MSQGARLRGDSFWHPTQPHHEIDCVNRLIDQHPTAAAVPRAPPRIAGVVFIGAVPDRIGAVPYHLPQLAALHQGFKFERQRLKTELKDHAQRDSRLLARGDHLIALADIPRQRLLT